MAARLSQASARRYGKRMGNRLEGKVAIVTGAASGIGKASVELFREHGATVVGADIGEGADERADAGDETSVRGLVEQVVREHGRLDIFFANAGVSGGMATLVRADAGGLGRDPAHQPHRLRAGDQICRARDDRAAGSIVCTASVAGIRSGAGGAAYSASKAGVINLVQNACQQLAGLGHPRQRHLPGPDRDRHDRGDVRSGARARPGATASAN